MKTFTFLFLSLTICLGTSFSQQIDSKVLEGLNVRNIGPAGMSGRMTAIDVDLSNDEIIYAGAASGGVWKSTDAGISWNPIFDEVQIQSIGAIKINQRNPSEIWVGTGEGNPRNSHNSGGGIFRSLDAGKNWKAMGLEETKTIHRILIDHHDPEVIYAGAMGSIWGPNADRGVFKSVDGGRTWKKSLYVNDRTGVGDLIMDPRNPRKIIAAMWEYGRTPWDFTSGGQGSGLYITYDAGENWKKITDKEGLPKGDLGRIGVAISRSKPNIVYALVEAKVNGLYKSTDGGENWKLVTTSNIGNRPFYYAEIYVDPLNENRLWNIWTYVSKSEDGGRTFETILDYGKAVHPDHHAWWQHPTDPRYIIEGNDGGLNISRDGGVNWRFIENIPAGQFYHVNVDNDFPYNVYGGMQDNGSWVGPAYVLKNGGIRNGDWREVMFGDGFDMIPRRDNSRYGFGMSQGGNIAYYDRETGYNQFIQPVHPEGENLRFNWNAALAQNPFSDCGIYFGSQFVHKSMDCGTSWEIISPDLTTNDTSKQNQDKSGGLTMDATQAENHTTILAMAPSPHDQKVIWVGTDDGKLQLTRDGGANWTDLSTRLTGLPAGSWIPQIEVSPHNKGEVFVIANNYRRNDWKPYAYHSSDFGSTWRRIAKPGQISSFTLSILQDPEQENLLFLGTDQGMYVSIDKGASWTKWPEKKFPSVPVRDMKIQQREGDLVIATFGRAFWIVDDIRPLREIAASQKKVLEKDFAVFAAPDAYLASYRSVDGVRFIADAAFKGANRQGGARMTVWVKPEKKDEKVSGEEKSEKKKSKKSAKEEVKEEDVKSEEVDAKSKKDKDKCVIHVLNTNGDTLRTYSTKLKEGFNLVGWDLQEKGIRFPSRRETAEDADDPGGTTVAPGDYQVVMGYQNQKDSTKVNVKLDPRLDISESDIAARTAVVKEYYAEIDKASQAFQNLMKARNSLKLVSDVLVHAPDSTKKQVADSTKSIKKAIAEVEDLFMLPEDTKGIQDGSKTLSRFLFQAIRFLNSSPGRPGQNAMYAVKTAKLKIDEAVEKANGFIEGDWQDYQNFVKGIQYSIFPDLKKVE